MLKNNAPSSELITWVVFVCPSHVDRDECQGGSSLCCLGASSGSTPVDQHLRGAQALTRPRAASTGPCTAREKSIVAFSSSSINRRALTATPLLSFEEETALLVVEVPVDVLQHAGRSSC